MYVYEPKGRAFEYGALALNLYGGCAHGCSYCYVPGAVRKTRENFLKPEPRKLDWPLLRREMSALGGKEVFLSFTSDPYQPINDQHKITRSALELFLAYGTIPIVLSKAGRRSLQDLDLLTRIPGAKLGATLTFMSAEKSVAWEPGAALPAERMSALQEAHLAGVKTWASLEPVIDPAESLALIEATLDFVDEYKVGRWNHAARANEIDWRSFGLQAVSILEKNGKKFYIKKDLAAFLQ